MSRDCKHGRLARSCKECDDEAEIAELREQAAATEKERAARIKAQEENETLKARLSRARLDLMRELKDQGWQAKPAALTNAQAMRVYNNSPLINGRMTFAGFDEVLRVIEGVHKIERVS